MNDERSVRSRLVSNALALLQTPYRWDGKDVRRHGGLDCSGFAEYCMAAAGIVLPQRDANGLWQALPTLAVAPTAGDLCFYGQDDRAHHVVVVLGPNGSAVIGANGGGPPVDGEGAEAYAARMEHVQAGVRIEDWRHGGARYRADFLGYRRLPWELAAP